MNQMYIGFAIIALMFVFDKEKLDIKLDKVAKFLSFMAIITAFRLALQSYAGSSSPQPLMNIPFHLFALVPWEDAFYVAPLLYLEEIKNKGKFGKALWVAMVVSASAHFGLGHLYQGWFAVGLTALYPYFISLKYSKRVGMGTVMVCHILYDMITYLTAKFGWMVNI